MEHDYFETNRLSWNNRVDAHLKSAFYNVEAFIKGSNPLNSIELNLLGNIKDKKILHLQCHFGQDSIALSRMGAHVIGVDLADKAIEAAIDLAKQCHTNTQFICCNIYDVEQHLNEQFDIVFTSYGTIGWLPDLNKWASIINKFLKPEGQFVFAEFHPVVWMYDDNFERIAYNYFNTGVICETETGTYADKNAEIKQDYVMWNHGLAEVFTSLLQAGLSITNFEEFDYSPYNCFNNTIEIEPNKYQIEHLGNNIPIVYALKAIKN